MDATYNDIITWVRRNRGISVKTCHVAHAKELSGLPLGRASNRQGRSRKVPCPPEKLPAIQDAFRHFGWDPLGPDRDTNIQ
jgi:hypothetical protein